MKDQIDSSQAELKNNMHIRIGTRKSALAIAQAQEFADFLKLMDCSYEIITITTTGDKITDKNLYEIGGKALFLKEIEEALLRNEIDIAVHSFKDVPDKIPSKLQIAAVLERKIANDVLLSFNASSIQDLAPNAKVGTSSVRRKAILLHHRPDLQILSCRGNVTVRVEKFIQHQYDAIILAASGLQRLKMLDKHYCHVIEQNHMLSAVAQGIIALEIRKDDTQMLELCNMINHQETWDLVQAERGFLENMNANCSTPLAAFAQRINDTQVEANFLLASTDGLKIYRHHEIFNTSNGYEVGAKAAKIILSKSMYS